MSASPSASSSQDPRAVARQPLQISAPYVDTRSGRFFAGRTRDVSTHGVFVEATDVVPVNTLVDLFIGGVGTGKQVLGRVVRAGEGGFAVVFVDQRLAVSGLLADAK